MLDERVILKLKPSPLAILLRSFSTAVKALVLAVVGWYVGRYVRGAVPAEFNLSILQWGPVVLALAWIGYRLVYELLLWRSREYLLSDKRVTSQTGILDRLNAEVPIRNVQQIVVDRTLGERLLGLGTVLVTSAGSQVVDVTWVNVARAGACAGAIREALDAARPTPAWLEESPAKKAVVIGLAGGIGSGKSAAARALADLGYILVDSDKEAKAALDRPEVRDTLVRWWGPGVADSDGRVDRRKVAEIVFADPTQRARLEGLVHPIVKASRTTLLSRAEAEGKPGVVVDAPLLFEAGSDAECDYVLFLDAPREVRIERIKSRGWTEAELDRRERAQIPLEEKRRRADIVIENDSTPEVLAGRIAEAERQLRGMASRKARPATG